MTMTENLTNKQLLALWGLCYIIFFGGIIAYAANCAPVDDARECAMQIKDRLSPYQSRVLMGHGYTYRSALSWCHRNEDHQELIDQAQSTIPMFPAH